MGRSAQAHWLRVTLATPACNSQGRLLHRTPMTQTYPLQRELHGIRYHLLAPPNAVQARFAFTGVYENLEVVWDTTLLTLTHYQAEQAVSLQPVQHSAFLEVGDETTHGRAIRVVLDIPHVDEPAILRTIIMVRNYKRLRFGRHEFGDIREPP